MKYPLLLASILLTACSPQIAVFSDADPDYSMDAYKTFDWGEKINIEEGKNPLYYNELNDKRIKSAVKEQLQRRGLTLSAANPDLLLHYHIIVNNQSVIATEPLGYRYGPYWMRTQTEAVSYREGTLILDLMDTKTNELVWRGWAVSPIDNIEPDKVDDFIRQVIEKIFKKFPASPHKPAGSSETPENKLL